MVTGANANAMFYSCKSQFQEKKNPVLPIEKFPSLVLFRNALMSQHLIIQFLLYCLSSGNLREAKNKRHFQTFSPKKGQGRLQEFGVLENWSRRRGGSL